MSELLRAILTERSRFISPVTYMAESDFITDDIAMQAPFDLKVQIKQDTVFLLQKFGVMTANINVASDLRVRGPGSSFCTVMLRDPIGHRDYLTIREPGVNYPGMINNVADLPDYILIPGSQYVAAQFEIIESFADNAFYSVHFTGLEFIMRQGEDITAIQELASVYMPPDYVPGTVVVGREDNPTLADVPAIDRAILLLQGRRTLAMNEFAQCECNYLTSKCEVGFNHPNTNSWLNLTQSKASEITQIDTMIATLKAKKQSAQSIN